jgi:beta-lactam-binding protein with PASTA domain
MSEGRMIFLTGRSWSTRLGWQWCICACLAVAILFVSGCAKVSVPEVEGLPQDAATTTVTGAKLKVGTITAQTSNTVAVGKVISQDPASGSSVAEGSLVNLVISSGPQMVAVPKVDGLTQDAATTSITGAKLKVGAVTPQTSDTVVGGKVISQDPASGTSVAEGSPVNLVISSGPQMMSVPKVDGLAQDAATTAVTAAKLTVGTVTQQASNTVAAGNVISQDPANGSSLRPGSPVNLVISSGPQVMVTVPGVEGLTQAAATTAITGTKLMVGTVAQQTSNTVVAGNVISQDPANGNSLAQGSPVNLVISSGPQMATVPNVEGLTENAATAALTEAKFKIGTVAQQTSDTVTTGRVMSQEPASGSSVAEGSPVNLVVSSGPQMVAVPNVEGLTQDAATTAITGAKLKVGTVAQQTSNTVTTGKVTSQDPASGSSVAQGSPVNLVLSSGPQMVTVPNVERLTQAAATTAITGGTLKVGTVTQQANDTVATGSVITQDPASGSSVAQGSPVNLVISSGPQMVTVPNVEGMTQAAATAAIAGAKLTVGIVNATGKVISQDPAKGSSVVQGSPVNLMISSEPQMVAVPNVEGMTQDAASTAITEAKLTVGTVTQQTSNTVAAGKVISQDPASGGSVVQSSPVNLVISSSTGE